MAYTLAQKILQMHTDEEVREAGQIVRCKVDLVLANDITAPLAIKSFNQMGAKTVFDKDKVSLVMDHFTPQKDIDSANQVKISREFALAHNLTHHYEGGEAGVEHALLPEMGLVKPGDIVIGADSHTCTYGGLGAFATGMGSTDIAGAMALGETWFKVPPTIRVTFDGTLPEYVTGKDLILRTIGEIGVDGALYKALQFDGSTIDKLLFASDETTAAYCKAHNNPNPMSLSPDSGAVYERELKFDVSDMEPLVAFPHLPENVKPVSEAKNISINQVVIGSCTNGRISDLREAAAVLKGHKVAKNLRCIVLPATPNIWKMALREGLIEIFMDSGCIVGPASCGPCLGGHLGILADGERAIATTNRNFKGRMGSLKSEVYLSNPAVAAASAVLGIIGGPKSL